MPLPWVLIPHFWTNPNIIFSATFLISIPSISLFFSAFWLHFNWENSAFQTCPTFFERGCHWSHSKEWCGRQVGSADFPSYPGSFFFFKLTEFYLKIGYIYIHHISIHFIHWLIIIQIFVCHSFVSVKSPTFTDTSGTMISGQGWLPAKVWGLDRASKSSQLQLQVCLEVQERQPCRYLKSRWNLVGGFKHFIVSIIYGIILPIDFHIFQDG